MANYYNPDQLRRNLNGMTPGNIQQPRTNPTVQPAVPNNASPTAVTPAANGRSDAWRDIQMTGKAKDDYQALLGAQPGSYQGTWADQIRQGMQGILDTKPFNYDINVDPLYQQIKDQYIKQGRQAMMDVQGQSAALTGGYGNTYGVLAGQQAYDDSLGQLSQMAPELAQLAEQKYYNDLQRRSSAVEQLAGMDDTEYQRFQYDTQQYETKLADAYQKYKASQGGGGKKRTDPRTDAEWFMGVSDETGYDVDESIDAVSRQMGWTKDYTEDVRTIVHQYTDYQLEQKQREDILAAGG